MKFSEKWLREWINFKINSDVLYKQISNSGIEVESVKKIKTSFTGVVVGEIVECVLHASLSNYKIVKVNIGKKRLLNIVCCASNCRNGIKVAVATIGAILPGNIVINTRMIKQELSEGMLCSFFELGFFLQDHKIIEFPSKISIGIDVNHVLFLKDNVIKISTTSNRPDGLSILGISRNIAAINNLKKMRLKNIATSVCSSKNININIIAKKACASFFGRVIEHINVHADTPLWMKKKLFFSDMLSDNVITNIINYVLIEIGQPINILNADAINNDIIVRMAKNEENIVLKDNIKILLNKSILVFSDINKILCLPGNINSIFAELHRDTKNIFLSSASITKESLRNILKKIDSNKTLDYYNYGIDTSLQNYAIEYATKLIINICGGQPGPITYKKSDLLVPRNNLIRVHYKKLCKIIGMDINNTIVSNILHNLNYTIKVHKQFWDVIPPNWRFDILIEEDVISDILRIYGYHKIVLNPLKEYLNCNIKHELIDILLKKCTIILINKGYYESINYSFIDPKIQNLIFNNTENILLSNPISQDMSCMRTSLWPGLLKNISYNKNRQQKSIRIFESGLCFSMQHNASLGVKQEIFLAGAISGDYITENWFLKTRKMDFYDLKGDLESILDSICILNDIEFRHEIIFGLHPEQSAAIYFKNNFVGKIGAIDPRLEKKLNVYSSTFLFEISLKYFFHTKISKFQEISKYPTIRRDIAIFISEDIMVFNILKTCRHFFIHQKVEVNLFDVYFDQVSSNKQKSIGISFIFQNSERTLQDNEINLMIHDCIRVLKKKFQVILRK